MLLDVILANESDSAIPSRRRVVKNVENLEAVSIDTLELFEVLSKKNVLLIDVSVNESDFGMIFGVLEAGMNDLHHRSDTCATRNHGDVLDEIWGVQEAAFGTFDTNDLT